MLGLDEYKKSTSPSVSSPESHNSDTSVEVSETRLLAGGGLFLNSNTKCPSEQLPGSNTKDMFMPLPFAFPQAAAFFPPSQHSTFLFPPSSFLYHQQPPKSHQSVLKNNNNNNRYTHNNNGDACSKRFFLDAILRSQQSPSGGSTSREDEEEEDEEEEEEEEETSNEAMTSHNHQSGVTYSSRKRTVLTMSRIPVSPHHEDPEQENPMDLSMKGCQQDDRLSASPAGTVDEDMTDQEVEDSGEITAKSAGRDVENEEGMDSDGRAHRSRNVAVPMDLTTRA